MSLIRVLIILALVLICFLLTPSPWNIVITVLLLFGTARLFDVEIEISQKIIVGVLKRLQQGDFNARAPQNSTVGLEINNFTEAISRSLSQLSQDQSQLKAVLNQMTEAVIAVDANGIVNFINPALSQLLSIEADISSGRHYVESIRHSSITQIIAEALKNATKIEQELRIFLPEERIFDAHAAPLIKEGKIIGAMIVLHDITRLRRLEQVRRDFVANVGHELRTPLASIKGYAETLHDGALDDKKHAKEFLKIIEEQSQRLSQIVDDLMDLTAIESGHRKPKLAPFPLTTLCQEAVRELKLLANQQTVTVNIQEGLINDVVNADREQVRQILVNLIGNAIKYNVPGGFIDISFQTDSKHIRVTVKDTGIGIPQVDLPRIFERFYRVDKARGQDVGGVGLGLSIVKHLVEANGGQISVDSRQPGGSSFHFTLPLS